MNERDGRCALGQSFWKAGAWRIFKELQTKSTWKMSIMASQNPIVPYTVLMCKWVNLISPAYEPHGQWFACIREKCGIALPLNIALNLDRILTSGSHIYKCNDIDWPQILLSLLYVLTEDYLICWIWSEVIPRPVHSSIHNLVHIIENWCYLNEIIN